jgi:LysR family transcriptional regulator (chromosome initiation inhibitor)
MLDYKLLEALAIVVQEGGFDKAAQRLNLTQSAVSQRIKQLEEQTGQVVIARTTPPRATKTGQQMVKHYLQIKQLEDDLFGSIIPSDNKDFVCLAIGTNRDCLATWLQQAVQDFLKKRKVVLEFRAADQEQTHQLMKDGDVMGCISVKSQAMQGCKIEYLGKMEYWLVATPEFMAQWLPNGITESSILAAPLILFDRKDEMHYQFFKQILEYIPTQLPVHYVPSTRTYTSFIANGLAYGLLPEQECRPLLASNQLINLYPENPVYVELYWHFWNLKSKLLEEFSKHLVLKAKKLLIP